MKKIIFFLAALMIVFSSCKKDDKKDKDPVIAGLNPTQTQWGFVYEYTRTNCGVCASVGAPLLHDLHAMGNVVTVAGHTDGGGDPMAMESALITEIYQDRPHDGTIPFFWVCNKSITRDETLAMSEMTSFQNNNPVAGIDLSYTISGGKMKVKTKSKFFSDATGEYLISVYLLEDDIDGGPNAGLYTQANGGANYKHMCVFRDCSVNSIYGETLASNPEKDKIIDKDFEFTLDAGWVASNTYPVAIIWQLDNSANPKHVFINAKEVKN